MILTITIARKSVEGTVAQNVLRYGCGGLNVDGSRVSITPGDTWNVPQSKLYTETGTVYGFGFGTGRLNGVRAIPNKSGRWPANLILTADPEVLDEFPSTATCASFKGACARPRHGYKITNALGTSTAPDSYGDSGSASRFFKQVQEEK